MDELVDVTVTVLSLVPAQYWGCVEHTLTACWVLGVILAAARPLLARWVPVGPARYWLDAFDSVLHVISASSKRLADRPAPLPKERRP